MACLQENDMATDENADADRTGGESIVDHRNNSLNPDDMGLPGEERAPKARKPYTITKQREKWSEEEHKRFLEALKLHGRAWRRIHEHIGTKTAVQIRSHAQKFFSKVARESSGSSSGSGAASAAAIQIPPPRPKRKPAHPYPRKAGDGAAGKHAPWLTQLEKPPVRNQPLRDQDDGSPTSVLTASALGGGFSNNSSGSRSPVPLAAGSDEHAKACVDRGDGCLSQSNATVELAMEAPNTKASERIANRDVKQASSEGPAFKLFGKSVVVKNSYEQPNCKTEHLPDGRNQKMNYSAAQVCSSSPWPSSMPQFLYLLPQDSSTAQSVMPWFTLNGSLPGVVLYQQAVDSDQPRRARSESADHKFLQREGSWTGSNTPGSGARNSDVADSRGQGNSGESHTAPVPRLIKCESSASINLRRGFVPYRRCAAESELPRSEAAGEEADGELTRLCL